jgi:hypothetical protein
MRALSTYPISRSVPAAIIGVAICFGVPARGCANVITDWDEKAVAVVTPLMASFAVNSPYMAQRMMGMVHAAMFDAVNSIERRYRPYLVQLPAERSTSQEAAAATAAASVLATIDQKKAGEMKVALATYLASIPNGAAKLDGVKLGEAVAERVVAARENDGCYGARLPSTARYVKKQNLCSDHIPEGKPSLMSQRRNCVRTMS